MTLGDVLRGEANARARIELTHTLAFEAISNRRVRWYCKACGVEGYPALWTAECGVLTP